VVSPCQLAFNSRFFRNSDIPNTPRRHQQHVRNLRREEAISCNLNQSPQRRRVPQQAQDVFGSSLDTLQRTPRSVARERDRQRREALQDSPTRRRVRPLQDHGAASIPTPLTIRLPRRPENSDHHGAAPILTPLTIRLPRRPQQAHSARERAEGRPHASARSIAQQARRARERAEKAHRAHEHAEVQIVSNASVCKLQLVISILTDFLNNGFVVCTWCTSDTSPHCTAAVVPQISGTN
jgi:hypothetical protein